MHFKGWILWKKKIEKSFWGQLKEHHQVLLDEWNRKRWNCASKIFLYMVNRTSTERIVTGVVRTVKSARDFFQDSHINLARIILSCFEFLLGWNKNCDLVKVYWFFYLVLWASPFFSVFVCFCFVFAFFLVFGNFLTMISFFIRGQCRCCSCLQREAAVLPPQDFLFDCFQPSWETAITSVPC